MVYPDYLTLLTCWFTMLYSDDLKLTTNILVFTVFFTVPSIH